MIWFKEYTIQDLFLLEKDNIHDSLGIKILKIEPNGIIGKMPVNNKTKQPMGFLHGGASVVLAESLGSLASFLVINKEKYICFGQNVVAHHLRPCKSGFVLGKCYPLHLGKKSHVWDIKIIDQNNNLVSTSRLTTAILPKN